MTSTSTSAPVTRATPVGELAARHPLATRVFARHHIDFCCGGGRPLGDVCEKQGLDVDAVISEIENELAPEASQQRWDLAPLAMLADHIVNRYHDSLREELPRLEAMARKVARVHGDKDPERLEGILHVFLELKAELEMHMIKEEQILFPMIRRGQGAGADRPIAVMIQEHQDAGDGLHKLRELTSDYTVPAEACNTWRALWHGLEALETDMHEHIHLENHILFPRALAGA